MGSETNKEIMRKFMQHAFNEGDLSIVDGSLVEDAVDHQELPDTHFATHLKAVITMLRTAFPDLYFEIHDMLAEGDRVAFRSTMTGTHKGSFRGLAPTGKRISVAHMHFVSLIDGKTSHLWHVWDVVDLMRQLGGPAPQQQSA